VLLNLASCAGADSLGIGELISLHVSLSNSGASLKLLRLPDRIRDLLSATQLISMFEIFEDEDEAVESFG
jgi:anti-sigma B factor antagonist